MIKVIGNKIDILKHYNNKRSFIGHFSRLYYIVEELFPDTRHTRTVNLNIKLLAPIRARVFESAPFFHRQAYKEYCSTYLGIEISDTMELENLGHRRTAMENGWSPNWDRGQWQRR